MVQWENLMPFDPPVNVVICDAGARLDDVTDWGDEMRERPFTPEEEAAFCEAAAEAVGQWERALASEWN